MKVKYFIPLLLMIFACGKGGQKPNLSIKNENLKSELVQFIDSLPKSPLYAGKFITVGIYFNNNRDTMLNFSNAEPASCDYVLGFTNLKDFRIYFCSEDKTKTYPFIEVKKPMICPNHESKSDKPTGCELKAEKLFYYKSGNLKPWTVRFVKLSQSDLNEVYGPYREKDEKAIGAGDPLTVETGEPLSKYLAIELVDNFNSAWNTENKRDSAIDFVIKDSTYSKKINGTLELKSKNKIVKLIDNNEGDGSKEYTYLGHIPFLNQFLVFGQYWENQGYLFIDMTTGKQTAEFHDYPYISMDKKYIASAYMDVYGRNTEFDLYSIKSGNIKTIMRVSFLKWMPATEQNKDIFWTSDNELVLRVAHVESFWTEDGNLNNQFQTIKIKVK